MKTVAYLIVVLLVVGALFVNNASALSYSRGIMGQDISWPNCNTLKFKAASFGIIGVNNGLGFTSNPCIGEEAVLYRQNLSLYLNTGFPGMPYDLKYQSWPFNCAVTDTNCMAYNYGYNAGRYAVDYALSRGVVSNSWWLDVETVNSWSADTDYNRESLMGEVEAIHQSVDPALIGYYTYPTEWVTLTGGWQNGYPNWVATDSNYKSVAIKQCNGFSFNGGPTRLTQYVGNLDFDLAC
jgi:hypothetical protein